MNTDLFIVTYAHDSDWFANSSKVAQANFKGYRNMVVVAPQQDRFIFDPIVAGLRDCKIHYVPDWPGYGYHWQQFIKCKADTFTDAEYIAHIDSDVFFKTPCPVDDFFTNGKPTWLWAYYTDLTPDVPWKAPTQRATGLSCTQEFMQGMPFILHRSTYPVVREGIRLGTGRTYEQHIGETARAKGLFSEFNAMGRIAWERQRDLYHWADRNRDELPKGFHCCRQFWSHAPLKDHLPEISQMLYGGNDPRIRTTNRGIWVISNDTHISKWVEQQGRLDFDTHFMNKICSYIKPGDTVVDVGANIGDHSWAYACATRGVNSGRVLAFEPNETPFRCLTRNMAGHGHATCIQKGLGEKPGRMGIIRSSNVGASYLTDGNDIEIVTLDSYELPACALIKIDAEGMELGILRGAEETVKRCRPVLVMEINSGALERQGTSAYDIFVWLESMGYRVEGNTGGPQYDIFCFPL